MDLGMKNGSAKEDPFEEIQIPPELEVSLQRHREHLARLILSMRTVGISEEQIEANISVIVASYKEELLRTMKAIGR